MTSRHAIAVLLAAALAACGSAADDTSSGVDTTPDSTIGGAVMRAVDVGGIEAEAVMLGQPYYMSIPQVIGVKLIGEMPAGTTAISFGYSGAVNGMDGDASFYELPLSR